MAYVNKVETTHGVLIPEPYRTILTEWPASQPPPGMHWPHSVRFFASGFCFCPRHTNADAEICQCEVYGPEVREVQIMMPKELFNIVFVDNKVPEGHWELFNYPVRLYTDEQNAQTMRFIRAHRAEEFKWNSTSQWVSLGFKVLILSRYHFARPEGISDGVFVMMLDGPTRGQIHAWESDGDTWYDGFEAESFWDWNYVEWDRNAVFLPHSED